jgi:hypothetical protein
MRCARCGALNQDDARFCTTCGWSTMPAPLFYAPPRDQGRDLLIVVLILVLVIALPVILAMVLYIMVLGFILDAPLPSPTVVGDIVRWTIGA